MPQPGREAFLPWGSGHTGVAGAVEQRGPRGRRQPGVPVEELWVAAHPRMEQAEAGRVLSDLRSLCGVGPGRIASHVDHSLGRMTGAAHCLVSMARWHQNHQLPTSRFQNRMSKASRGSHAIRDLPLEDSQCHFCSVGHNSHWVPGLGGGSNSVSKVPLGQRFSTCGSQPFVGHISDILYIIYLQLIAVTYKLQ